MKPRFNQIIIKSPDLRTNLIPLTSTGNKPMTALTIALIALVIILYIVMRRRKTTTTPPATTNTSLSLESTPTPNLNTKDTPQPQNSSDANYTYNNDDQPLFDQKTLKDAINNNQNNN